MTKDELAAWTARFNAEWEVAKAAGLVRERTSRGYGDLSEDELSEEDE